MKKNYKYSKFNYKISDTFSFSKAERNGIIVLIIFLLLLFFLRFAIIYFQKTKDFIDAENPEIEQFMQNQQHYQDSILALKNWKNSSTNNYYNQKGKFHKKILKPFAFDPNTLPLSDWIKLGFTEKQAQQIINYRSKGGYFYQKTDLKKMYCITEEDYQILENYIHIPSKQKIEKEKTKIDLQQFLKIELNTADSIDLQKISGIGQKTASQIIAYRKKLGGYVTVNQLNEVYIIDSNRFMQISPYLYADLQHIKKININKADIKELINHPYIDFYLAKSIVNYRQTNGNYTNIAEIKKAVNIYEELYQKIVPYLSVE